MFPDFLTRGRKQSKELMLQGILLQALLQNAKT